MKVQQAHAAPAPQDVRHLEPRVHVVALGVSVIDLGSAVERVLQWSALHASRYLCLANVHMVMESFDTPAFAALVNGADLVLSDGMPLVWAQRLLGQREASRVPGPELTETVLDRAARVGIPVGFYGGSPETLAKLLGSVRSRWPDLHVAVSIAPPFRPLTPEEDAEYTRRIAESGARVLFVGIGCPKQERWMAEHVERVPCVMLGVGQAFDLLSGTKRDAPRWMQAAGLGWLFRLSREPRRLWRRYAANNPRFLALLFVQWVRYLRDRRSRVGSTG
jgi:N-acetylglucosaminyldiphosphoundecaprenol N-acetyl-beta-D-mannosaminyltransferase